MGNKKPVETGELFSYLVLRPIGMGGRVEAGNTVKLTKSEANNYPPEYLKLIDEVKPDGGDAGSQTGDADKGLDTGNASDQPKTVDHVVTQEDLNKHGHLRRAGIKVGDTIQIPESEVNK